MPRYFVCHRHRAVINIAYAREFLKLKGQHDQASVCCTLIMHDTYESALAEIHEGFYDDSDYCIVELLTDGSIKILR